MQTVHEVNKTGNLFFLLNGLNGALNKIGDALMRGGGTGNTEQLNRIEKKVDQILKTIEADPEALKAIAAKIRATTDTLESAVKNQQPKNQRRK